MRGRDFTAADNENTAPVAIVNQTFVKRFFKSDEDPMALSVAAGALAVCAFFCRNHSSCTRRLNFPPDRPEDGVSERDISQQMYSIAVLPLIGASGTTVAEFSVTASSNEARRILI